jgi:hypothetical protein
MAMQNYQITQNDLANIRNAPDPSLTNGVGGGSWNPLGTSGGVDKSILNDPTYTTAQSFYSNPSAFKGTSLYGPGGVFQYQADPSSSFMGDMGGALSVLALPFAAAGAGIGGAAEGAGTGAFEAGGWGNALNYGGATGAAATGGGMEFDPTADFGGDYFSGANNYTNSGTFGTVPGSTTAGSLSDKITNWLSNPSNLASGGKGLLSMLGSLGAGGLQALASNRQANSLSALANQYMNLGGPSRARFEASMTPGFDPMSIPGYAGALDSTSKAVMARLAAQGGNPYGNPGGLIDANKAIVSGTALPAIQNYQGTNLNAGYGPGFGAGAAAQTGAINANANVLAGLGSAVGSATAPDNSLASLLAQLKASQGVNINSGTGL